MLAVKKLSDQIRAFWIDHLWADLAVVALVLLAHGICVIAFPAFDVLGNALPADRRGAYSATAVVVSLLGSFSSVAISQLGSAKGARANALKSQAAETLARNWRSIFRAGMLSALLAVTALVADPSQVTVSAVPVVARWLFEAGLVFAVVKFLRLSSLFYEVITLTSRSAAEDETVRLGAAPTPDPHWASRAS